jgi:hypothetical protein
MPAVDALAAAGAPLEAYVSAHAAALGAVRGLLESSRGSKVVGWGYPPPHFGKGMTVEGIERQLGLVEGLGLMVPVETLQQQGQLDKVEQLRDFLAGLAQQQHQQQEQQYGLSDASVTRRAIGAAAAVVLGGLERVKDQGLGGGGGVSSPAVSPGAAMLMSNSKFGSNSSSSSSRGLWSMSHQGGVGSMVQDGAAVVAAAMHQLFSLQLSHVLVHEVVMLSADAEEEVGVVGVQSSLGGGGGLGVTGEELLGSISPGARQAYRTPGVGYRTPGVAAAAAAGEVVCYANGGVTRVGRGSVPGVREQAWQQQQQWQQQVTHGCVTPPSGAAGGSMGGMGGQQEEHMGSGSMAPGSTGVLGTGALGAGGGGGGLKEDIVKLASRLRVGLPDYLGKFLGQT